MSKKFLIGQLASFGDCLYVTTIAKQIKTDFPDCHLTWAIAKRYKSILDLNPYIDVVWEIEIINNDYYNDGWEQFEKEAKKRKREGIFDEIFLTQIGPKRKNYDGTIRSSTFRGYPKPITIPVAPVIRLSMEEILNVKTFSEKHQLSKFKEIILFEYAPNSGQSFVNLDFALSIIEPIVNRINDICFILSGPKSIETRNKQIIDASHLSFRENAELTKYCTFLIGCSSGITWLATSDWAKKLNTMQLLNRKYDFFAGVKYDLELWNLPTSHIIEITNSDPVHVSSCLNIIFGEADFNSAKKQFDEVYKPDYFNFQFAITGVLWSNKTVKFLIVYRVIKNFINKNAHLYNIKIYYISFIEICRYLKNRFFQLIKKFSDNY